MSKRYPVSTGYGEVASYALTIIDKDPIIQQLEERRKRVGGRSHRRTDGQTARAGILGKPAPLVVKGHWG